MDLNFLWPLLGGAFGAAIVNSAFGFYKQKSDANLEKDQWRRDQRQVGYAALMTAGDKYISTLTHIREGMLKGPEAGQALTDTQTDFFRACRQILLIAPPELVKSSTRMRDAANALMSALKVQVTSAPGEARDESWTDVTNKLTQATTEFILMARLDLGMHDVDGQTKARIALAEDLKTGRTWPEGV